VRDDHPRFRHTLATTLNKTTTQRWQPLPEWRTRRRRVSASNVASRSSHFALYGSCSESGGVSCRRLTSWRKACFHTRRGRSRVFPKSCSSTDERMISGTMRRVQVYPRGAPTARDAPRLRSDDSSRRTLNPATVTPGHPYLYSTHKSQLVFRPYTSRRVGGRSTYPRTFIVTRMKRATTPTSYARFERGIE
jgi:hypothetical protein